MMRAVLLTLCLITTAVFSVTHAQNQGVIAITGATIHTMTKSGTLRGATMVIRNGKISELGTSVAIPADARIIRADGQVISPGLFQPFSSLGLSAIDQVEEINDEKSTHALWSGLAFHVASVIDFSDEGIILNRANGLVNIMVAPALGASVFSGQASIIDARDTLDGLVQPRAAIIAHFDAQASHLVGGSRAAFEQAFNEALDYRSNRADYLRGQRYDYHLSRQHLEALQPVLDQTIPLGIVAHRAPDILASLDLADRYQLDIVIIGASEAWKVADRLASTHTPVVIDPCNNLPTSFETRNVREDQATLLHQAGVIFSFTACGAKELMGWGSNGNAALGLRQSAGIAVAHGLPWISALRAITTEPARIWKYQGSIIDLRSNAPATFVIWNGDPLELSTYAHAVMINGRWQNLDSRQRHLRDRYRNQEQAQLPFAYRGL